MRPLPCLMFAACTTAPTGTASSTAVLVVQAVPTGPVAWVTACGLRRRLPADGSPGVVAVPAGAPCAVQVHRDDGGVVARSSVAVVTVPDGTRVTHVVHLPPPGSLGAAGFTLVPAPDGARVLPLDMTPRDPLAPHPAWLADLVVDAVDGQSTFGLDAAALDALGMGAPGSTLVLALHDDRTRWTVPFQRQPPSGHPAPDAVIDAWLDADDDVDLERVLAPYVQR